jgi:hypothetical protein
MSAGGTKAGSLIFEMDLDRSKMEKGLQDQLKSVENKSQSIEKAWSNLGTKSDEHFNRTKAIAIKSYEQISQAGFKSAEEQARAMMMLSAKVEALTAKQQISQANQSKAMAMQAAVPWDNLGIRSTAAIRSQIDAVNASYATIKKQAGLSSQDLINIERGKNEQLKQLNAEMVGQHDMSMAAMARAALRLYAVYYIVSSGIRVGFDFLMSGIKAIDDLKLSTIAVAAQITTMQGPKEVTEHFRKNVIYANELNKKLMEIDANSFANLSQIQKMNMAMVNQGVILDINKAKQIESFTALANAVALFTQGQDKEKQASQEMRALFTGQVKAGNMVAMQMDALIRKQGDYANGLKGLIAEGKKHGDTLERMQPYLVGIVAASGDIQQTWEAVSSSLETSWSIIQRGLFKDIYKDLTKSGREFTAWLKANEAEIVKSVKDGYETVSFAVKTTIAFFALFTAAAWASCTSAGDAAAWFALRWEVMTARVTFATSKMLLGLNVFSAAIIGFQVGGLLNKFEFVREQGVHMVYHLVDAWARFVYNIRIAAAALTTLHDIMANPANAVNIYKAGELRRSEITKAYEAEKEFNKNLKADQLKDITDVAIAKKEAEENAKLKKYIEIPGVTPGLVDDPDKAKAKERELQSATKRIIEETRKTTYELASIGRSQYEKDISRIESDAEKYRKLGVDKVLIAKFVATETSMAEAKAYEANRKIAQKAEDDAIRDMQDQVRDGVKATKEHLKGQDEYKKIMEDSAVFSTDTHEQAMKRIIQHENEKLAVIQELRDKDYISVEEAEKAKLALVRNRALEERKLSSETFFKENADRQEAFSSMAQNFSTMANLYAEDSRERQALSEISKAATIAEMGLQVQKNLMIAVGAVVNQGTGDPYTAFARIAAMIAVVTGVLSMAGIAFGNGGGGSSSAAASTPVMGNSTVLGAAYGTGSESIANSLELLQDTYDLEDVKLTKIYNELKSLNDNIIGLVSSYIRTGGVDAFLDTVSLESSTNRAETLWGDAQAPLLENYAMITRFSKILPETTSEILGFITGSYGYELVGKFINKLIGNVLGKVFGGDTESSVTGGGIQLYGGSIAGILKNGVGARQYATGETKTDGGWFHSDKTEYWTQYAALDGDVTALFSKVYQNLSDTLIALSEGLGTNVNDVLNYTFAQMQIDLHGKTGEEISKALSEAFSAVGDTAVKVLFGDIISQYQKVNEGMLETATRLITDKESILNILEYTNQSFEGTTSELIKFSESLITVAGSLENLTDAFNTYYDAFFSDAEKQADLKSSLSGALGQYGYALPGERSGYRSIVESQNLASEAGQTAYAALMLLADSADAYYSYLEDAKSNINESDYSTRVEYLRAVNGYAGGGDFGGGYRVVGENGPELEYTGPSHIYSNSQSKNILNFTELAAEIKAMRNEMRAGNYEIAKNTQKAADVLDDMNVVGMPAARGW